MTNSHKTDLASWLRDTALGDAALQLALIRLLVRKGLLTEAEVIKELRSVQARSPQEDLGLVRHAEEECRSDAGGVWHPGGSRATALMAEMAGITSAHHVLDVGCALGGAARQLAESFGCRVTGLDADFVRILECIKRTKARGLDHLADFIAANAFNMPFEPETFDVVWRQFAPITPFNEERLLAECARVLKRGGVLVCMHGMKTEKLTEPEMVNDPELWRRMLYGDYRFFLERAGFRVEKVETEQPTRFDVEFCQAPGREKYLQLLHEGKLLSAIFIARRT
jgi:SAM-dependent methyltransferase